MFSVFKAIAASLAILAMAVAQSFGVCQGYVCECSGEPVHSTMAECHPGDCHTDAGSCGEEHSCSGEIGGSMVSPGHDCPPHMAFAGDLMARTTPAGFHIPAPALVAELAAEMLARAEISSFAQSAPVGPDDWTGSSPPAALVVARTMVMLV